MEWGSSESREEGMGSRPLEGRICRAGDRLYWKCGGESLREEEVQG